jgi:hypothetical protein
MPLLKRVLLFFAELSIPIFAVALALALVYRCGSEESDLLVVAFFGILVVSVIMFVLFQSSITSCIASGNYSQRASSVPSGMIVASRSGPVEIMPISTCRKSAINRK